MTCAACCVDHMSGGSSKQLRTIMIFSGNYSRIGVCVCVCIEFKSLRVSKTLAKKATDLVKHVILVKFLGQIKSNQTDQFKL